MTIPSAPRPYTLALLSATLIDREHAEREGRDLAASLLKKLLKSVPVRVVGETSIAETETHRTPLDRTKLAQRPVVARKGEHGFMDIYRGSGPPENRPTSQDEPVEADEKTRTLVIGLDFFDGMEGYLEVHFFEDVCILDFRLETDDEVDIVTLEKRMEPVRRHFQDSNKTHLYYWEWIFRVGDRDRAWVDEWLRPEIVVDLPGPRDIRIVTGASGNSKKFAAIATEESLTLDRLYFSRRQVQERVHKLQMAANISATHRTLINLYNDLTVELQILQSQERSGSKREQREQHEAAMVGLLERIAHAQLGRTNEAYHYDLLTTELDRLALAHPGLTEWIRTWTPPKASNGGILDLIENRLRSIESIDARHQDRLEEQIQELSVFFGVLGGLGLLLATLSLALTLLDLSVKPNDRHGVANWLHDHGPALGWGVILTVAVGLFASLYFSMPKWRKRLFKSVTKNPPVNPKKVDAHPEGHRRNWERMGILGNQTTDDQVPQQTTRG